jgi:gliding motility-associated-like protein
MKKTLVYIVLLLLPSLPAFSTHNRAGEITYRQIAGYTYEFTVTTFTFKYSAANRSQLEFQWGDNSTSIAYLVGGHLDNSTIVDLPSDYYYNRYTTRHTFPGPGIYKIMVQDPNRNYGVRNIPNSVNVVFSIATTLLIAPEIGTNNTPRLLNFPIDKAALGHIFIHNPNAYDPDGDSIAYDLTICTGQDGVPITGYTLPLHSDTFYVDAITGDMVWNTPIDTGKYNVAMDIMEYRHGIKISNIVRDMQINVYQTDNNPPVNPPLPNFCVVAGDSVVFQFTTTDQDGDPVIHTLTGGPFVVTGNQATCSTVSSVPGSLTSLFRWHTDCNHIRRLPYQVTVKSKDVNNDIELVDIDNFYITVLAPPPVNLTATPSSSTIDLKWESSNCGTVTGYRIYRCEGKSGFEPDSCENGVPFPLFTKVDEVDGSTTEYSDDNNGEGLSQGILYCYRVTALYKDGAESIASAEACADLVPGFPALLNVSVTKIGVEGEGEIFLSWAKPRDFDTADAPGPYVFQILRSLPDNQEDLSVIDSIPTTDLEDTTYYDRKSLNTLDAYPYYYSVKMFNNTPGNRFEMKPENREIASSLYITIVPKDNQLELTFRKRVPWIDSLYVIYRSIGENGPFDSLTTTSEKTYTDSGLENKVNYCYITRSIGWRPIANLIYTNSNRSHRACGMPEDNEAPCAPELEVRSVCDSFMNALSWTNPNNTCADDVLSFNVYYSPSYTGDLVLLDTTVNTVYNHQMPDGSQIAGCYAVSAIDSVGNESPRSATICVDNCVLYELPNVFTPNGDGNNDVYVSNNLNDAIQKVDMKIFNRFGHLVYQTSDPAINWDGSYRDTKGSVSPGVYYYICDVYEPRINGIMVHTLTGFIHLYTGEATVIPKE